MDNKESVCYNCFRERQDGGACPHCGYDPASDREKYPLALKHGSILGGQYITGRVLGQGGFGITYLALDHTLGLKVAIKEYLPERMATRMPGTTLIAPISGDQKEDFDYGAERFLDEARVLAKFSGNPGIAAVRRFFSENGTAYFAMDYVDGVSFKSYLLSKGDSLHRIPWEDALRMLWPVMDTLAAVHKEGFIHRDVTPDNIYITGDGGVKLLDFGSARYSLGDKSSSLDVILKAGYAPKEQYMRRGRQGPYTDVYSLCATFYTAVTGYLPPEALERLDEDRLAPISAQGVAIPDRLEQAILTGLAVQPENRFQTITALQNAIRSAVGEPQPLSQQPSGGEGASPSQQPYTGGGTSQYQQPYTGGGTSQYQQPYAGGGTSQYQQPYAGGGTSQYQQPYAGAGTSQPQQTSAAPAWEAQPEPGKRKGGSHKLPIILGSAGAGVAAAAVALVLLLPHLSGGGTAHYDSESGGGGGDMSVAAPSADLGQLAELLGSAQGNTPGNLNYFGYAAEKGEWIYYADEGIYRTNGQQTEQLIQDDVRYLNVVDNWVYYCDYNDDLALCRVRTDGAQEERLMENPYSYSGMRYLTVTREWIYYVDDLTDIDGTMPIRRVPTDLSGDAQTLVEYGDCMAVDGDWIYYVDEDSALNKIRTDGSQQTCLDTGGFCADINLWDDWVYYLGGGGLYRVKQDGTGRQVVVQGYVDDYNLSDGKIYCYFFLDDDSEPYYIYRAEADGSDLQKISDPIYAEYLWYPTVAGDWLYFVIDAQQDYFCRIPTAGGDYENVRAANGVTLLTLDQQGGEYAGDCLSEMGLDLYLYQAEQSDLLNLAEEPLRALCPMLVFGSYVPTELTDAAESAGLTVAWLQPDNWDEYFCAIGMASEDGQAFLDRFETATANIHAKDIAQYYVSSGELAGYYTGYINSDNRPDGWGVMQYEVGDRYMGYFSDGMREGYGVYYWASGQWYEGEWSQGERGGQGTQYAADGSVLYSGTWSGGEFVG